MTTFHKKATKMGYEEIAGHMDISVSMVYKHLAKAIKHFMMRLDNNA